MTPMRATTKGNADRGQLAISVTVTTLRAVGVPMKDFPEQYFI